MGSIIAAIVLGIIIAGLIIVCNIYPNEKYTPKFESGVFLGAILAILTVIEIIVVTDIIEEPKSSALDVYRGNTELEITSVNGMHIDTVVVFKKN